MKDDNNEKLRESFNAMAKEHKKTLEFLKDDYMEADLRLQDKVTEELDEMLALIAPVLINGMMQGATKHGVSSWKDTDNPSLQHTANHNSLFHHVAESYSGVTVDKDSGQHPLSHVVLRCIMDYYRREKENLNGQANKTNET